MAIDYKGLLEKYVAIVACYESHIYTRELERSGLPYTEEEISELWKFGDARIVDGKIKYTEG